MSGNSATPTPISPETFLEQALQDIQNEEALDLADDAELGLPAAYDEEVMVAIGIEHADNLLGIRWRILNARLNHKDDEVKTLAAAEMASRHILTLIKRQCPAAHRKLQMVLRLRAENIDKERQKAVEG